MFIANMLGLLAALFWLLLVIYVVTVLMRRSRGENVKISIVVVVVLILLAAFSSTLSAGLVVIDAGEVGVVFNSFSGTKETPLYPGLHFVTPYIETVYRYSTLEQVYTMSINNEEGQVMGDDSLWSPTLEGLQVGIDSSTRYKINPAKAAYIHNNLRDYNNILVRPSIRSIVRLHVSQYTVTNVYGPRRAEIQGKIEDALRKRFEEAGLLLLSFDIRNVNFTKEYARSIEQKQIAQQQAEQMEFVLDKQRKEAERMRVEAAGFKDAAIIRAQGEAESLKLISEALAANPNLLMYRYIEKLAPNTQVMMVPNNTPFIFDLKGLGALSQSSAPAGLLPVQPTAEPESPDRGARPTPDVPSPAQ
jgi:regulator of protease activity HflC (stomatin/prohibitin superfamily)